MDTICQAVHTGNEKSVVAALVHFNETNKTNFRLGEAPATRKVFCTTVLSHIKEHDSDKQWSPHTIALALNALRIFAREPEGVEGLVSKEGMQTIAMLAELGTSVEGGGVFGRDGDVPVEKMEVIVESVKVLCNIVLNNRHLAPLTAEIGCLNGLSSRLALSHTKQLPHDVLFFDLRLLFLITACGPVERVIFRDECNGLSVLINVIDSALFGPSQQTTPQSEVGGVSIEATHTEESASKPECSDSSENAVKDSTAAVQVLDEEPRPKKKEAKFLPGLAPLRDSVCCVSTPVTDKQCIVLCDALKVVFNQTLHWREEDEYDEDELCLWSHISHLVKIILLSVPPQQSKSASDAIGHCAEVLVNTPEQCACMYLLPPQIQVMPTLCSLYPNLYHLPSAGPAKKGGDQPSTFTQDLDCVYEGWNMTAVVTLVNYLDMQLKVGSDHPRVSPVLTGLRVLCKGHRSIRRFMKSQILPPIKEVRERPDQGDTLKSRIVRLMTAGSRGAEEVAAELLFVLCKENAARLVKHTGFGNAAGLLLSRGLLGGGKSKGEDQYSSDSETSDTEEYEKSRDNIDPVTGGPSKGAEPSPLDHMTEEEKEREAGKLSELFDRLNRYGVIKVMPVDKDGQPVLPPDDSDEDETN